MKKRRKVIKIIGMIVLGMIVLEIFSCLTANVLDMIGRAGYFALPQFDGVLEGDLSKFWYDEFLERDGSVRYVFYDDDYLREGELIAFQFYKRPITDTSRKNVHIWASKYITDTMEIDIDITYDYVRRTIIYEPLVIYAREEPFDMSERYSDEENIRRLMAEYNITEEDIREFQEYVLYDVILKSWQRASGSNYDSEKRKLQWCRVEDLTFEFE